MQPGCKQPIQTLHIHDQRFHTMEGGNDSAAPTAPSGQPRNPSKRKIVPILAPSSTPTEPSMAAEDVSDSDSVDSVEMDSATSQAVPTSTPKVPKRKPSGVPRRVNWSDAAGKKLCEVSSAVRVFPMSRRDGGRRC